MLSDDEALRLAEITDLDALMAQAREIRDARWGKTITFSPKVFLPLTNLCRNRCDYCSFRKSPGDPGEWTMRPHEVDASLARARELGCTEALFCLGDKPENAFSAYRETLTLIGHDSTVDYLCWAGRQAIKHGLLPHTNAGILTTEDMTRLRVVNVSLGLMLESSSERLCQRGMPHHKAPDKRPHKRLKMIAEAGALRIPFTTGILIGIGETRLERIESLLAIRRLARAFGHIQEVIVQSFRARPGVPMENAPEPDDLEVAHAVAMARLILDPDIGVQAPPNLHPEGTAMLVAAGINDFGGISPVTPDFINPLHAWPHVTALRASCEKQGYALEPRLAIYDSFVAKQGFLEEALRVPVRSAQERLQ
jgi:FO synthase